MILGMKTQIVRALLIAFALLLSLSGYKNSLLPHLAFFFSWSKKKKEILVVNPYW